MKISMNWLQDYIEIQDKTPQEIANLLTHAGLEVEGIEDRAQSYKNVVVGHILEKGQHPNADRLTLCQVTTGEGRTHQIICGAKNHKAGDRVVVALPGAILPGNFEIKLSKLRGVESQGMLCSEKELALSEESEGIMILPEEAPIGKSFSEYAGFNDVLLELKVTPNRADCLSQWGIARELSCLLDRPLKTDWQKKPELSQNSTQDQVKLDLQDPEMCPRYTGIYIEGVQVGPSPSWLKQRLESVGMNSINNIVDVTNYVMMELGQPLHAFDVREIKGNKITISKAKPNEKFVTLDGTEVTLQGSELMIRDQERSIALAGVVGGANSGIQEDTKNIFLESAYFTMEGVRKTSRLHGIQTESAYRFSRGVDPTATLDASMRAVQLIVEVAGGTPYGNPHDAGVSISKKSPIDIKLEQVTERLGYVAESEKFVSWMKRLGCEIAENENKFKVTPPLFRQDLEIKEDLIEEYARLEGFENIPEELPKLSKAPSSHVQEYSLQGEIHKIVQAEGFLESFNYAFVSGKQQDKWLKGGDPVHTPGSGDILIQNPLSEELNTMRRSLFTGLFQSCLHNLRHSLNVGRLYELGYTFHKKESAEGADYNQNLKLGFILWGEPLDLWSTSKSERLFFEMKSTLEVMFRKLQIKKFSYEELGESELYHPGQSANIRVEGRVVGSLGVLHPSLLDEEKVRVPTVYAEIHMDPLFKGQPRKVRSKSISKFPMVERDFAFVMPKELKAGDIIEDIQKVGGSLVKSVTVFDVFEGGSLATHEKSVAFRVIYQSMEKTWTDAELQDLDKKIIDAISQKHSVSVR